MPPRILGLVWDEWNVQHVARHRVEAHEVEEAIEHIGCAKRSRNYLLILGQTYSGRYLAIVVDHEGQ